MTYYETQIDLDISKVQDSENFSKRRIALTGEVDWRAPATFGAYASSLANSADAILELIDHKGDMWRHSVCVILKHARYHGLIVHPPPKGMFLGIQCRG